MIRSSRDHGVLHQQQLTSKSTWHLCWTWWLMIYFNLYETSQRFQLISNIIIFFTRWLMSSKYTWNLQSDYCNCVASMYYLHLVKKSTYWLCCMVLYLAYSIYETWWKTHKHVWWFFQCLIKNVWYLSRWTESCLETLKFTSAKDIRLFVFSVVPY